MSMYGTSLDLIPMYAIPPTHPVVSSPENTGARDGHFASAATTNTLLSGQGLRGGGVSARREQSLIAQQSSGAPLALAILALQRRSTHTLMTWGGHR
jgi:hypothetical protein